MCFVIIWFSINYLFVFSSTRKAPFLYGDRPVSLRWSPCFSTSLSPLVSNILHPLFSLPASSFLFCQNLSHVILSISFFLFPFYPSLFSLSLARASICARIYYNVPPFFFFFSSFHFYVLQHLCKSASYKKVFFLF